MSNYFRPLKGQVIISELERGMRKTAMGILLPSDDMKEEGIRQRWAKVFLLGEDVTDLKEGEWILLPHGRWTNGFDIQTPSGKERVWKADRAAILLVSAERPSGLAETVDLPGLN